jgi:uncharacterized protein YbjT (DUF2867 family)
MASAHATSDWRTPKGSLPAGHFFVAVLQERIVRRSKLDWVIVRPVILTDGPKTNAYRASIDPRDWKCGFISRADVADFLVKQIGDDAFLHKTPVLNS